MLHSPHWELGKSTFNNVPQTGVKHYLLATSFAGGYKKAFQQDAYRSLRWPSLGVNTCMAGVDMNDPRFLHGRYTPGIPTPLVYQNIAFPQLHWRAVIKIHTLNKLLPHDFDRALIFCITGDKWHGSWYFDLRKEGISSYRFSDRISSAPIDKNRTISWIRNPIWPFECLNFTELTCSEWRHVLYVNTAIGIFSSIFH